MEWRMEKLQLARLAHEVMRALEFHASCYPEEEDDSQIYDAMWNLSQNELFFKENVKKAVFTLAYLYRAKCRVLYAKNIKDFFRDPTNYREFLLRRKIIEDRYPLRFLAWISFAFEMTMCCYRREFTEVWKNVCYVNSVRDLKTAPESYIETCKRCIEIYPNMAILADRKRETKWWKEIQEAANHIAAFHDTLVEAMERSHLKRGILPSFQGALNNILKLKEYKLKMTQIIMFRYSSVNQYNRTSKLQPLSEYCPKRISLGHTVVRRNKRTNTSYLSSTSRSTAAERGHSSRRNVQMEWNSPSTSSGVRNVDVPRSNVLDDERYFQYDFYKKSAFVISNTKLERVKGEEKTGIRDIKIYYPPKEKMRKVPNLHTVLKETVKIPGHRNRNLIETFSNNTRTKEIVKQGSNPIIVMDSSEEEEEDDDEPLRTSFIDDVLKKWKEFSLDDVEVMNFFLSPRIWIEPEKDEYPSSQ